MKKSIFIFFGITILIIFYYWFYHTD